MRKLTIVPKPLPASHLMRIQNLGLMAVSYRRDSRECDDGTREWLPRDIIGKDGKSLIVWREADSEYTTAGYEPWHDGMFGGRRAEIHNALSWLERAIAVRNGTAKDFLGC